MDQLSSKYKYVHVFILLLYVVNLRGQNFRLSGLNSSRALAVQARVLGIRLNYNTMYIANETTSDHDERWNPPSVRQGGKVY